MQRTIAFVCGGVFIVVLMLGVWLAPNPSNKHIAKTLKFLSAFVLALFTFFILDSLFNQNAGFSTGVQIAIRLVLAALVFVGFLFFWQLLMSRDSVPAEGISPAPTERAGAKQDEKTDRASTERASAERTSTDRTVTPAPTEAPRRYESAPPSVPAVGASPSLPVAPSDPVPAPPAASPERTRSEAEVRRQKIVAELIEARPEMVQLKQEFANLVKLGVQDQWKDGAGGEGALAQMRAEASLPEILDALEQNLIALRAEENPSTERIGQYTREVAEVSFLMGDIARAEHALDALIELNPNDLESINRKGHTCAMRGDLRAAAKAYRRLLDAATALGDETFMAAGFGNLGSIYEALGEIEHAESMHRKSLELEEKNGRLDGLAADYGNLGRLYQARGEFEKAEEYYRKALEIAQKMENLELQAVQYSNLGTLSIARNELDEAEMMIRHALVLEERLGRSEGMADGYANLGMIHLARRNLEQAAEALHRALYLEDKLGRLDRRGYAYANLGQIFLDRGDVSFARKYWTQALNCFAQIPIPERVQQIQKWLVGLTVEEA